MSYKFNLPYVISAAALLVCPAASQPTASGNNNNKDKIVKVNKLANVATHRHVPSVNMEPVLMQDRDMERQMDSIVNTMLTPVRSEQQGKSVVYVYHDGRRVVRHGGSRAWRNNNPGNLRYYEFSKRNGAIGEAGNFAVFPDEETGMQALYNLLQTDSYKNLTIANALKRYCKNWRPYTSKLTKLTGLSADTKLRSLNQKQLIMVTQTIRQLEGWIAGREHMIDAPQYAMVNATKQKAR